MLRHIKNNYKKNNHKKHSYKKTHTCILLMLLLSLLITFGGWLFTKQILKYKETQLFSKSGRLHVADSGYSLYQDGSSKSETADESAKSEDSDIFYGEAISEDLIAQILSCWDSGSRLLSHEPQEGQMNMEQAISAGYSWIADMIKKSLLPANLSEKNIHNVSAVLYTQDEKPDFPDYLLSRWIISYTADDTEITLTIHAASGQVWQAGITAQSDNLPVSYDVNDKELLLAAFPFIAKTNSSASIAESEITGSYKIKIFTKTKKLSASANWHMITTDGDTAYTTITLELHPDKT